LVFGRVLGGVFGGVFGAGFGGVFGGVFGRVSDFFESSSLLFREFSVEVDEDEVWVYFEFSFIQERTAAGRNQPENLEQSFNAHDATPNCFLLPLLIF